MEGEGRQLELQGTLGPQTSPSNLKAPLVGCRCIAAESRCSSVQALPGFISRLKNRALIR